MLAFSYSTKNSDPGKVSGLARQAVDAEKRVRNRERLLFDSPKSMDHVHGFLKNMKEICELIEEVS